MTSSTQRMTTIPAEELEQLRARARHYRAIIAGLCMRLRGERAWVRHLERIIEQQGRILDAYHLPRTVDK